MKTGQANRRSTTKDGFPRLRAHISYLATKADIESLRAELKSMRWSIGVTVALIVTTYQRDRAVSLEHLIFHRAVDLGSKSDRDHAD